MTTTYATTDDRRSPVEREDNLSRIRRAVVDLFLGDVVLDVAELPGEATVDFAPSDIAVFPIRVLSGRVLLGPLAAPRPGAGPCWRCLELRWIELRGVDEQHAVETGARPIHVGEDPQLSEMALTTLRSLVQHKLSSPRAAGTVIELNLRNLSVRHVALIAHSFCEICGNPSVDSASLAPKRPTSARKSTPTSYRARSALSIGLPKHALVNDLCGTLAAQSFTVYQCTATLPVSGFFRVRSRFAYHDMWWSGQSPSSQSSEVLGMLEGLERYAGQQPRARSTAVVATRAELGSEAVDPRGFGEYSPEFYAAHTTGYEPFRDNLTIPWVWGYSFGRDEPVLVPEQLVYYLDRTEQPKFTQECSSGCATGGTFQEATFHGLLELIERDAFVVHWYGHSSTPEIDVSSLDDREMLYILDRAARAGYRVRFFDIRVDIPVPTVMAVAERMGGGLGQLIYAAAASFDPVEAFRGALAEVASYLPSADERTESRLEEAQAMSRDYSRVTELTHHALLYGLPEMASVAAFSIDPPEVRTIDETYAEWLRIRPGTLDQKDDLLFLADQVRKIGGDVFVVDQTAPEQEPLGVFTACVLSDALIPIDFGHARQRVVRHPRLHAFIGGELNEVNRPSGERRLEAAPHPFP